MVSRLPALCLAGVLLCGLASVVLADEPAAAPAATPAATTPAPKPKPLQVDADRPVVPFNIQGSLRTLNDGRVSPWGLFSVDNSRWVAGLGAGTLRSDLGVGEMLTLAGRTFIRTVDPKKGVKLVEVTKPYQSPFTMAILRPINAEAVFPRPYLLVNAEPGLLHTALENLAKDAGTAIGVIGWAEMPEVEGAALKRAPIDNESLTGSKKDDYLETIRAKDANVAFFAVVVPAVLPRPSLNASLIGKLAMDYDPAQGQPSAALIHVHAALIDQPVPQNYTSAPLLLDKLSQVGVKDICHLYGFSTIKKGMFLVYRINLLAE
jgi:hypothetical protein